MRRFEALGPHEHPLGASGCAAAYCAASAALSAATCGGSVAAARPARARCVGRGVTCREPRHERPELRHVEAGGHGPARLRVRRHLSGGHPGNVNWRRFQGLAVLGALH